MRGLSADDEERYRDYLRASLAAQGHDVSTVDAGRVAIDHGVRFRPQVLVPDWMLRADLPGLRVSRFTTEPPPTPTFASASPRARRDPGQGGNFVGEAQVPPLELVA